MNPFRTLAGLILLAGLSLPSVSSARAQEWENPFLEQARRPVETESPTQIKQNASEILSSPEFRHFERIQNRSFRSSAPRNGMPGNLGQGNMPPNPDGPPGQGNGENGADGGMQQPGNPPPNARPDNANPPRNRNPGQQNQRPRNNGNNNANNPPPQNPPPNRNWDPPPQRQNREPTFAPRSSGSGFGSAVGALVHVIAWGCLAAIVAMILYLIGQAVLNFRLNRPLKKEIDAAAAINEQGELQPETSPGELPADLYLSRARELADMGNYREAIAQLILGAMSSVERAGLVKYRQGLTHRDYVRALRSHENDFQAFRSLVRTYEPIGFGRREANREQFLISLSSYETGFRKDE